MAIKIVTNDNFDAEVLEAGRPVLVDFWAPWCGYCRRLAPVLEGLAAKRTDLEVVTVNVDDAPSLAARFGIELIPTLFLFKGGVHGEKLVAPETEAKIEDWIAAQG